MGQIITLTGPSGAGKSKLISTLCTQGSRFVPLKGVVTRAARQDDRIDKYAYVTTTEFDALSASGQLIGESPIHANRYATFRSDVLRALYGDAISVADLDITGAEAFVRFAGDHGKRNNVIPFYLSVRDESELRRRLTERGEERIDERVADCVSWEREAFESSVPFVFIDGTQPVDHVVASVLSALGGRS